MNLHKPCIALTILLIAAGGAPASLPAEEERLELETAKVTGNRELPRIMAIVPWKKAPPGELPGRPARSLLDEALTPVDRLVMRREVRQRQALQAAREAQFQVPDGTRRPEVSEEE
ncbi:hypothetical protein [Wenzhouxiangella sp. XN24]|uniref:hypothetical protein n=1 Tax=Wenzhouxiangella sp. XN24 TaxID=2713569 RepID=UPI0013EB75EF|nr:hypothetical protein [Wenzhouxiangella sp. XN24]NGX15673.1 hypothetical protein [Wenzhouxiangella sp. XN24]